MRAAAEATGGHNVSVSPVRHLADAPPWHRGRVVLIGDAAHSLTPQMTSGGGLALEDSVVLAQRSSQPDVRLATFSTSSATCRFPRVKEGVRRVPSDLPMGAASQLRPLDDAAADGRYPPVPWGSLLMQRKVSFTSVGLTLAGVVHIPDDLAEGERRPGILVLHGFGGSKDGPTHIGEADLYESFGYVALRFDMRGCGESEGVRGHILCPDQVVDTQSALSWLAEQPYVQPDAIAVSGQSFGGAVALYTGGIDDRIAAVISIGGWGNGARKLQGQHPGAGEWDRFLDILATGRRRREQTGETLMVKRWDIVPVPEHLRSLLPPTGSWTFRSTRPKASTTSAPTMSSGASRRVRCSSTTGPTTASRRRRRRWRSSARQGDTRTGGTQGRPLPLRRARAAARRPGEGLVAAQPASRRSTPGRGRTRRIVTGNDAGARSIVDDRIAPHRYQSEHAPNVAQVLWATDRMPAIVNGDDPATADRFFTAAPAPNGTDPRIVDFPPDSEYDAMAMKKFLATIVPTVTSHVG